MNNVCGEILYHWSDMRTCTTWFVIAISIFGQECSAKLTVFPNNTVVLEGSETALQCKTSTSLRILWRFQHTKNATSVTIYTGNKFSLNIPPDTYNIDNGTSSEGQFDLRIAAYNTTAGRYICDEPGSENASAELIILASDPVCTHTDDNATGHRMQCIIRFAGNWAPVMEWRQVSGGMEDEARLITAGIINNTTSYTVISVLTVNRTEPRSKYTCITKFNANGRPRLTTATNIPEYSYNWTYPDDTIHTSSTTAESSSTLQQSSSIEDILSTTTAHTQFADNLIPILIFLIIICILLAIMVCVTYKNTNEGCISKCQNTNKRPAATETTADVTSNGVDELSSPQVTDEDESNQYVQFAQGANYLQLCPGSVASLPVAKSEQGKEPPCFSRYIGGDGTEYMEMNGFRREPATAPQIHPNTYSHAVYAQIDHTLSNPSPNL